MATKVKINFAELSNEDLAEKLGEEKALYKKMKFNHSVSSIENPLKIRASRRNIARILTEKRKRDIASKNSK